MYASGGQGLRTPKTLPKCLPPGDKQQLLAKQGVGRGQSVAGGANQRPGQPSALEKAVSNSQKHIKQFQKGQNENRYIPGLDVPQHKQPSNVQAGYQEAKDLPAELIENFLNGSKNPVSALMEYCAITKLKISFQEAIAPSGGFGCECSIEDKHFSIGSGRTKKEAKANASKLAFNKILGQDTEGEGN